MRQVNSCQRKLPDNLVDIHPPKVDKTGHPQTLSGEPVKYIYWYLTPRLYITTVNVNQSNRYILCLKFSTTEEGVEGDSNHSCLFLITMITLSAFRHYDIVKENIQLINTTAYMHAWNANPSDP